MNRIILIGNGFDLGTMDRWRVKKTLFKDIDFSKTQIVGRFKVTEQTDYAVLEIDNPDEHKNWNILVGFDNWCSDSNVAGSSNKIEEYNNFQIVCLSKIWKSVFEAINQSIGIKNWVDIESEYCLRWRIFSNKSNEYTSGSTQRGVGFNKRIFNRLFEICTQNQIKLELIKGCIRKLSI